ncbi:Inosine-5'-monophosphate dehydrogenase [Pantoea agglomerans]|uniref:Inosine-5'-monophosphate dehydrogenase n=1 Tax=Enterobacter agglomerans TaxID=549 RepID=A0A379ACB7_ENTAG|nr:Inosine-5'-monophosphate dehydrogenase [Pantoea agglomerans]
MLRIAKEALTFDDVSARPCTLHRPAEYGRSQHPADQKYPFKHSYALRCHGYREPSRVWRLRWHRKAALASSIKICQSNAQADEVRKVKKHESGVVTEPQTVLPTTPLADVKALTERNGFAGYPVV